MAESKEETMKIEERPIIIKFETPNGDVLGQIDCRDHSGPMCYLLDAIEDALWEKMFTVDEKTTLKHDGLIDFDFCLECGAVAPKGPGGPCPKCDQFVADGVVQC